MKNQERFDRIKKALALRAFPNELYVLYTDTFQYGLYAVSIDSIKVFRRVIETQKIDAVQELPKEEVLALSLEDFFRLME